LEITENHNLLTFYRLCLLILTVDSNDASLADEGAASGGSKKEKKSFECILVLLPFLRFELNSA